MEKNTLFPGLEIVKNPIQSPDSAKQDPPKETTPPADPPSTPPPDPPADPPQDPVSTPPEGGDPPTDPSQDPPQDPPQDLPNEGDVTAEQVFHTWLVDQNIAEPTENPTSENIEEVLNQLPQKMFGVALTQMHEDSQRLMQYAYNLGTEATADKLSEYFTKFQKPAEQNFNIEEEEGATAFLRQEYTAAKTFADAEDLDDHLNSLKDKGKLLSYAKNIHTEKETARVAEQTRIDKATEAARVAREKADQEHSREVLTALNDTGWTDNLKSTVIKNLAPEHMQEVNSSILQSPKALVQLGAILQYYDVKKGEFDMEKLLASREVSNKNKKREKALNQDSFSSKMAQLGKSHKNKPDDSNAKKGGTIQPKVVFP